jgi:hypothetical protein
MDQRDMTDYPSAADPFVDATGRLTRYGHQWLTTVKDEVVEAATQATLAALTDITAELTNRLNDLETALANAEAVAAEAVSASRIENIVPQLASQNVKVRGLGVEEYMFMPTGATFNVYSVTTYGVPGGTDPGPPPGEFDILEP